MESPSSLAPSWPHYLAGAIIAIISAGAGYFATLINKKKLPSEIHKTDAEAELTLAQRDDLQLRTNMTAGQMMREMNRYIIVIERRMEQKDAIIRLQEKQIEEARAQGNLKRLKGD
jgi:hypothetical protein